jgi:hypothetical protein
VEEVTCSRIESIEVLVSESLPDIASEHLPQLHSPLVEAIDPIEEAMHGHAVLIQ